MRFSLKQKINLYNKKKEEIIKLFQRFKSRYLFVNRLKIIKIFMKISYLFIFYFRSLVGGLIILLIYF